MKTSKKVIILLIFLAVLSLACSALRGTQSESVQSSDENTGWQTIKVDDMNVSFIVPSSWNDMGLTYNQGNGVIEIGYVSADDFNRGMVFHADNLLDRQVEEEFGNDMNDPVYWGNKDMSISDISGEELLTSEKSYNLDGYYAVHIEYIVDYGDYELHYANFFVVKDNWALEFSFYTSVDDWQNFQPFFMNMVDQIEID